MTKRPNAEKEDPQHFSGDDTAVKDVSTIIVGGGHGGVNLQLACMFKLEKPDKDYLVLERDSSLYSKWRK
jgi:cation diffusion facilitator CzcD-associated flavoprotein CzcO